MTAAVAKTPIEPPHPSAFPFKLTQKDRDEIRAVIPDGVTRLRRVATKNWVDRLANQNSEENCPLENIESLVTSAQWSSNSAVVFLIQALMERVQRDLSLLNQEKREWFERLQWVYTKAKEERALSRREPAATTALDAAPKAIVRPHLKVHCLVTESALKTCRAEVEAWSAEAEKKCLLADTLNSLQLLSYEKYNLAHDSDDIIKLLVELIPRRVRQDQVLYGAYDDKNVLQGVAMCWEEGARGYHLKLPATAPRNIEVLCAGKEIVRGTVTAVIRKIALDVLKKIGTGKGKVAPRLFCEPSVSAIGFYKKLGFVEVPVVKEEAECESSASESESDDDVPETELAMNREALLKFTTQK